MMKEFVYQVDENDNVVGKTTRKHVIEKNLWHRGTGVMVINTKGELLVHQRTVEMDWCPGYYDTLFGGIVRYGEAYEESAYRELWEETGIKGCKLEFMFKFQNSSSISNVHFKVFKVISDGPFCFQKEEVIQAYFVPLKDVEQIITKKKFTPGGIKAFKKYVDGMSNGTG